MAIERLIDEQARKWQKAIDRRKLKNEPPPPVITISRQAGSGGEEIARLVAETLDLDIFDREIIHEVAESVHMSEKVVASLDEKTRSTLDNWIQYLKTTRFLLPGKYLVHLTKVIGTIGEQGGAVIIGRGANLILPPEETLRIRIMAPLDERIKNVAKEQNISPEKAKEQIVSLDTEYEMFIKKHFDVDINDPSNYDLTINTHYLTPDSIVKAIQTSLKYKKLPSRRRFDPKPAE